MRYWEWFLFCIPKSYVPEKFIKSIETSTSTINEWTLCNPKLTIHILFLIAVRSIGKYDFWRHLPMLLFTECEFAFSKTYEGMSVFKIDFIFYFSYFVIRRRELAYYTRQRLNLLTPKSIIFRYLRFQLDLRISNLQNIQLKMTIRWSVPCTDSEVGYSMVKTQPFYLSQH